MDLELLLSMAMSFDEARVAVTGPSQQGLKDWKVEGTLEEFYARGRLLAHCVAVLLSIGWLQSFIGATR